MKEVDRPRELQHTGIGEKMEGGMWKIKSAVKKLGTGVSGRLRVRRR